MRAARGPALGCALVLLGVAAAPAGAGATVPQTRITFGPEGWTNISSPTFAFESTDPDANFECRTDTAPFRPCGPVEEEATLGPPEYDRCPRAGTSSKSGR